MKKTLVMRLNGAHLSQEGEVSGGGWSGEHLFRQRPSGRSDGQRQRVEAVAIEAKQQMSVPGGGGDCRGESTDGGGSRRGKAAGRGNGYRGKAVADDHRCRARQLPVGGRRQQPVGEGFRVSGGGSGDWGWRGSGGWWRWGEVGSDGGG
ncbi:hypothetical protein GUJ93_ZPchr0009g1101 [Zizania palustris]|uniref:Uncharacterized protein n=1 Tax=Zizania palustris TaxID=103762 RepID=A0A8J5RT37_ZIZPA|nr:hypothetical protein GUJ93_ZPchr0009g1101 [Zizania palustris]